MADNEEREMRSIWKRNEKRFEMEDGYLVKMYPRRSSLTYFGDLGNAFFSCCNLVDSPL